MTTTTTSDDAASSMDLSRTVLEAASWHLASELQRRHPHRLNVYRTFPGGGLYDCLTVRSVDGARADLNREGNIHVRSRAGGDQNVNWSPVTWSAYLSAADRRDLISALLNEMRLGVPSTIPSSNPPVLTSRLIARLAALHMLSTPLDIDMGFVDSSTDTAQAPWFREFSTVAGKLAVPIDTDPASQPGYRFWRVHGPTFELTLETSSGTAWGPSGKARDLQTTYADNGREIDTLCAEITLHARA